jgi:PPK2 family polyphosphate:nucleotide phosphotransferase
MLLEQAPERCRVREGESVDLRRRPTRVNPLYHSKEEYHQLLAAHLERLQKLQRLLYASNRFALLVIFQAMDAAGKDGAIAHVMSGVNPQGCQVFSFKHPSVQEQEHDFLWRTTRCLPERGQIGIFNRSYYEEVLIARVHPEILKSEGLAGSGARDGDIWRHRYESILGLERHLYRNGTRIVKFFLHLSKGEQRKRFLRRIDDPDKRWKFSPADLEERKYWSQYRRAYQACLNATSTAEAPWYIVPADDKKSARLMVSQVIVETLGSLKMSYPTTSARRLRELQALRRRLADG